MSALLRGVQSQQKAEPNHNQASAAEVLSCFESSSRGIGLNTEAFQLEHNLDVGMSRNYWILGAYPWQPNSVEDEEDAPHHMEHWLDATRVNILGLVFLQA